VQYLMVQMRSVRAHWRNTAYNFTRFFILAIQVGPPDCCLLSSLPTSAVGCFKPLAREAHS
jgi:hypothetical protein